MYQNAVQSLQERCVQVPLLSVTITCAVLLMGMYKFWQQEPHPSGLPFLPRVLPNSGAVCLKIRLYFIWPVDTLMSA